MTDSISKEHRSWNMSQIRSKHSKPEKDVRSILHRMGYRFRLHVQELPGKPDIVLPKYKTIIFVHGCFWHRHEGCKYAYMPKSRTEFWNSKFVANIKRDRKVINHLKSLGWNVLTIWECEVRDKDKLIKLIKRKLC